MKKHPISSSEAGIKLLASDQAMIRFTRLKNLALGNPKHYSAVKVYQTIISLSSGQIKSGVVIAREYKRPIYNLVIHGCSLEIEETSNNELFIRTMWLSGEFAKKKKIGCGQMCRGKLYAEQNLSYVLAVEAGIPWAGLAGEIVNADVTPTGVKLDMGYTDNAYADPDYFANPGISFDKGLGGAKAVVAFDVKDPDSVATINMIFGMGMRFHLDSNARISGVGFGVGFGANMPLGKFKLLPKIWKSMDVSFGSDVNLRDIQH